MNLIIKNILLSFLVIVLIQNTYSQSNWAQIGAEWYYTVSNSYGNPFYSFEKYVSEKDTTIEGKACKIIKSQNNTEIMYEENDSVFYRFKDDFKLIYEFASNVGDTVAFDFKSPTRYSPNIDTSFIVKCVIVKIDTIDNIRQYQTSIIQNDSLDFIVWKSTYIYRERIGHEYGFMFNLSGPSIDLIDNLRCYNDSVINFITDWWSYYNKACDFSLLNSKDQYDKQRNFSVFPNPTNNKLTIISDEFNINHESYVIIIDTKGNAVFENKITQSHQMFDISNISPGIYYINIINSNIFLKPIKIIKL